MILAQTQDATPSGAPDPDLVTPGTIGFVVTLVVVIVVIFLIRDALKRVRRVRARAQASDAYPIPLRKHAVPNQSRLSGASAPESESTEAVDSEAAPGEVAAAENAPKEGASNGEAAGDRTADSDRDGSVRNSAEKDES